MTLVRRPAAALVAALAGALLVAVPGSGPAPARAAEGRYAADVRRTEYGIPHISAKDHGGLGYGHGYAFAQDNLCVMASWALTLRGERSRHFGAEAMSDDAVDPISNLASDVYHKSVQASGVLRRVLARPAPHGPSAALRALVDGYVAGFNRYLSDTGVARLPDPACRGKAWVGPITATDVWMNLLDLGRLGGSSRFKEAVAASGQAEGERPSRQRPPRVTAPGSNAYALGREATRGGHGMLLADPHFPWNGSRRFYQVYLTIPGVLDVAGGSLYGTPMVQIGHNASMAWTHTVSHAQRFTLYQLELAPGQRTAYLVDGRPEPMGRQEVTVTVRDAQGAVKPVTTTLFTSRYGPVLADGWTKETAIALADANAVNLRFADEWLAMSAARDVTALRRAQETYQGMPFVYTLAADVRGESDGEKADVRRACDTLAAWDGRARLDSRGAILWREFFMGLNGPQRRPGGSIVPPTSWWKVPFDAEHPLTTPRGLDIAHPVVQTALADAVRFFTANDVALRLTPGQAQRYGAVPVPGCTEGEGCFDRIRTSGPLGEDGRYPDVNTGSSFMMAVELTPAGPRTRTVLTYSLSANSASPHHADQTELFSRGEWVTERFTEAEIQAYPHLVTTSLR
ncbi:peptidase S45 [Nonomuraea diastatica]|uniref:Peptidase S45 n=2 Tax=Nonomuraea diastatica TaxID=1848329 RepID=A0A4R4WV49_9ACTN|nr:peptidase S45 [Nonomuraea diastatica]